MRLLTIGFTQKTAEQFFKLVEDAGAKCVSDIRLNNATGALSPDFLRRNGTILASFISEAYCIYSVI